MSSHQQPKQRPRLTLKEKQGQLLFESIDLDLSDELPLQLETLFRTLWPETTGVVLGHATDGVWWGLLDAGKLTQARDVFPDFGPPLRWETLLDLRIFGGEQELRIWRSSRGLKAVCLREGPESSLPVSKKDSTAGDKLSFDAWGERAYLVLGAHPEGRAQAESVDSKASEKSHFPKIGLFTTLYGRAGQRHAPPNVGSLPSELLIRHYYAQDEDSGMYRLMEHRYRVSNPEEGRK